RYRRAARASNAGSRRLRLQGNTLRTRFRLLARQDLVQRRGIDGLDEMHVEPGFAHTAAVVLLPVSGQRDQVCRSQRGVVTHDPRHPTSIHSTRKAEIAQYHLGAEPACRLYSRGTVVGDGHLMPADLEQHLHALSDVVVVLNDEDTT